jgi:hypothetical protein
MHEKTHRTDQKKNRWIWWETCVVPEDIQSTESVWGALHSRTLHCVEGPGTNVCVVSHCRLLVYSISCEASSEMTISFLNKTVCMPCEWFWWTREWNFYQQQCGRTPSSTFMYICYSGYGVTWQHSDPPTGFDGCLHFLQSYTTLQTFLRYDAAGYTANCTHFLRLMLNRAN